MTMTSVQAQEVAVLLLRNFADGEFSGYAGDVMTLPEDVAQVLIDAGAAEPVVEEAHVKVTTKPKGKGR
jgi:hypothetical protein